MASSEVGKSAEAPAAEPVEFEVRMSGTVDISASLEMFRRAGDDGLDRWDGGTLVRTIPVESGVAVAYACTPGGTLEEPMFRVRGEDSRFRTEIEQAVGSTFATASPEFAELLRRDPVIARLEGLYPGVRQVRQFDLLASLVRAISAQQVNLRWAATTRGRLAVTFGKEHLVGNHKVYSLDAERLAAADPARIRALQFTTRKAEYIVGVAREIADGRLSLTELSVLPDEEVLRRLTSLRGIGRWTAEWVLARTLGRPSVVAGDLAVRKAIGLAYLDEPLPLEQQVRRATSHWGSSAGVAQALLLHGYGEGILG